MLQKTTLLAAILIAAHVVATSIATSAWALSPQELSHNEEEQRRQIATLIQHHAPNRAAAERMIAVAACESTGLRHVAQNGQLVRNRSGSGAMGVLQIMPTHIRTAETLGLDIRRNVHDYITYAFHLYRTSRERGHDGFTDWRASRRCWNQPTKVFYARQTLRHLEPYLEVAEASP